MLRGSSKEPRVYDEAQVVEGGRQLQYNTAALNNQVCQDLEIVDACRGTTVGRAYIGKFKPFEGECDGQFYPGLPIYWNQDSKLYLYPIDKYPDDWSSPPLRGMVRWRIASFRSFEDKLSCRREEANIFQIDMASDGQPYNYYPTIHCFDEKANDFSGFKVSTITVICHDIVTSATSNSGGDDGEGEGVPLGLIAGIAGGVLVVVILAYCCWKRQKTKTADADEEKGKKKEKPDDESKKAGTTLDSSDSGSNEGPSNPFAGLLVKAKSMGEVMGDKLSDQYDLLKKSFHGDKDKDLGSSNHEKKLSPPKSTDRPWKSDHQRKSDASGSPSLKDKFWSSSHSKKNQSQKFEYMSSDDESSFADEKPISRKLSRKPSREIARTPSGRIASDPPARSSRNLKPEDPESAVPKGIRDMVSRLDSFLVNNFEKDPKRKNSVTPPAAINIPESKSRSRSLEPNRSSESKEPSRSRSLSKERSKASEYEKDRSRSSKRLDSSEHAAKPKERSRSISKERSKASDYEKDKSRSSRRLDSSQHDKSKSSRSRSSSKERSKSDSHADKEPSRSRSSRRLESDDDDKDKSRSRSRSKERSDADKNADRGRSRSKERSDADKNADRGRSRSHERSKADDFADNRREGRSRSKERSGAGDFADKVKLFNNKPAATPKAPALPSGTIGKTKPGSKPLDASAAARTVTKNDDGSVLVTQKRKREDGAIVTTKTKYATVALARKHGIDV